MRIRLIKAGFGRGWLLVRAFAQGAFSGQLALTAHGFGLLALFLLRGFLEVAAQFHFAIDALALHLLLERAQGLVDIVVADTYLNDGSSP